jgi:predicted TIM-barrel fold metal-dependent hydrolase
MARFAAVSMILFVFMTQVSRAENQTLVDKERERCGEVFDMHLHPANYSTVDPILNEMNMAGISRGIIYAVYAANNTFLPDANTQVSDLVKASKGRLYGLASLDTSGDWPTTGKDELERLSRALRKPAFKGVKLAPPHTCLELNGTVIKEVIETVSKSAKPVVGIHTGTTPFCGEFGEAILGYRVSHAPLYAVFFHSSILTLHNSSGLLQPAIRGPVVPREASRGVQERDVYSAP